MQFDITIIGGGASGLVSAIICAESGKKVCLIEKETKLGKKILQTGNGKCNLSNENLDEGFYNQIEVKNIFNQFGLKETKEFFSSIGIDTFADEEERLYPFSESAKDVAMALELKLESLNIEVLLNTTVTRLEKSNTSFTIETDKNEKILSEKVIVATGGNTAKTLLSFTNHNFSEEKEVLVGFRCSEKFFKTLAGVRVDASLKIEVNNKTFFEEGQIQLRENGISGIVVFNASAFVASSCSLPVKAEINFLPNVKNLEEFLKNRRKKCAHLKVENFLIGLLNKNLATVILERANLSKIFDLLVKSITDEEITRIAKTITSFSVTMVETFGEAQVHAGGIKLCELNNFESKFVKNLFVCGEAIDVFGRCGGYNLQWAWSSGAIAGANASKEK
ncbi:MAG: aminoacetone oxidase family FAD-binding enzyme [Clostridia bacterium]